MKYINFFKTKNILLLGFFFLASCSLFQKQEMKVDNKEEAKSAKSKIEHQAESKEGQNQNGVIQPEVKSQNPLNPDETKKNPMEGITDVQLPPVKNNFETTNGPLKKVAIILGPGGLRAFGHVGVLQQLTKSKINISSISGIEMGSLVAALYSKKAQTYDVEWQMNKLKEDFFFDKSLLSEEKPAQVSKLIPYLKSTFEQTKVEDGKIPFTCLAFNLPKQQNIIMNRGPYFQMLPFCLGMYPLFQPFQNNIAATTDLKTIVDYLKTKGAQYIIYVDILGSSSGKYYKSLDNNANITWNIINQSLQRQLNLVDYIIRVPLENYGITDFNSRREIVQTGSDTAIKEINEILKRTRN